MPVTLNIPGKSVLIVYVIVAINSRELKCFRILMHLFCGSSLICI